MRNLLLVFALSGVLASDAFAGGSTTPFSVGAKVGLGSVGLPGLGTGSLVADFGALVQRDLPGRDSLVAGFGYQRSPGWQYEDEPRVLHTARLASCFVGYKSRLAGEQSGPYLGATVGLTRWSGRPGDTGLSPTLGGFVGAELAVRSRSRLFVEIGTRYGNPTSAAAVPHWNLGVGYATGF
jgi:hypothetical protein